MSVKSIRPIMDSQAIPLASTPRPAGPAPAERPSSSDTGGVTFHYGAGLGVSGPGACV